MSSGDDDDVDQPISNNFDEEEHHFATKRKKRVQFIDDEEDEPTVKASTKNNKKAKLSNENVSQKEFLESVLFESDESSISNDIEENSVIFSGKHNNEPKNNNAEDNTNDYYGNNILDRMNFSDSDDLDDFIENDESNITKNQRTISTYKDSVAATNFNTIPNISSKNRSDERYQLAVEIFGEDFDYGDLGIDKPPVDNITGDGSEYVSDENDGLADREDSNADGYTDSFVSSGQTNYRNIIKKTLNELFEPEELERQYLTETDKEIRMKDIPERFQTRSYPVKQADNDELDREANWIYENYFDKSTILFTSEKRELSLQTKKIHPTDHISYIKTTLNLIRNELCEIPFILTYRHENINGIFTENELWMIYRADCKWYSFLNKITQYTSYLKRFKEYQSNCSDKHTFYYKISDRDIRYLKNIRNDYEFLNLHKKHELYIDTYRNEFLEYEATLWRESNESNKITNDLTNDAFIREPNSFNRHHFLVTKDIGKVVTCFGLSASDFDENIRVQYQKYSAVPSMLSPDEVAEKYTSNVFSTCDKVIDAAVDMYVIEVSHEQHVRRCIYQSFIKNARLKIYPTKKGIQEIDESHPCSSFKYIVNKPLKNITAEMFIKLNEGRNDKLLEVTMQLPDNVKDELLDYLKSFQNISSNDDSPYRKEWHMLRCKAIDRAVEKYILLSVEREVYQKLLNEAHNDLVLRCGDVFKNHLIAPPYSLEIKQFKSNMEENLPDFENPFIMVISVPPLCRNYNKSSKKSRITLKTYRGRINHPALSKVNRYGHRESTDISEDENDDPLTAGFLNDEIGYMVVMDEFGESIEYAPINNSILFQRNRLSQRMKSSNLDIDDSRMCELFHKKVEQMLVKYNICGIFIPLIDREYDNLAKNLTIRLQSMKIETKPMVHLVNPYITNRLIRVFSRMDPCFNAKLEYERALSIGRYAIDPLVECANLFVNDYDLTFFNDLLSPYQKYLKRDKVREILEEKLVSIVNEIGVDLNRAIVEPRYSNLLQFVCGLGPRKAKRLITDMREHSDTGRLNNRSQLVTVCNFGPKIFINCAGFLKIVGSTEEEGDIDMLDATRVHPELYDWTRKIMIDALDIDETHNSGDPTKKHDYNDMLETLRNDSSKLKDLDLDAFANELMRQGISLNKKYSLELIITEMLKEFPDYRPRFIPLSSAEKFWVLANGGNRIDLCETIEYSTLSPKNPMNVARFHNEDLIPIHIGKLIPFTVTSFIYKRPDHDEISRAVPEKDTHSQMWICPYCFEKISHDLKKCWDHIENVCPGNAIAVRGVLEGFFGTIVGIISLTHISDTPPKNIKERVGKGFHIMCQVLNIRFDRLSVDLTCRTSDLYDKEKHCLKFRRDAYYDLNSEEEQYKLNKKRADELKNQVVYHKRVITHPSFKNVSYFEAEKLLETIPVGGCIIRPSSKGIDHLTVTWKVQDNIYQHTDIMEMDKPNYFSIGKKLWIKGECYDDLDEILARYISPMSVLIKEITNLKVYHFADGGSRHKMASILSEEKKANPSRIPYIFSPCKIYPGKFLLGFLPRSTPLFEYVSVTPDGVKFRDIIHVSFQEMIKWFKNNFNQPTNNPLYSSGLNKTPNAFSHIPEKNVLNNSATNAASNSTTSDMITKQNMYQSNRLSRPNQTHIPVENYEPISTFSKKSIN